MSTCASNDIDPNIIFLPLYTFRTHFSYFRIQTSYVPVEPKRRPQQDSSKQSGVTAPVAIAPASSSTTPVSKLQREDQPTSSKRLHQGRKGAPLRRSRIIITVKRTDDYKQWLEANPHLATGHGDDIDDSPT